MNCVLGTSSCEVLPGSWGGDYEFDRPNGGSASTLSAYPCGLPIEEGASRVSVASAPRYSSSLATDSVLPCLYEAVVRLAYFRQLEPNWDSYGAARIAEGAIKTANAILCKLQDELFDFLEDDIRPRTVAPLDHGGVQLEWVGPAGEIEIEIDPSGELSYLLVEGTGPARKFREVGHATLRQLMVQIRHVLAG